jgi:hypothetical protein
MPSSNARPLARMVPCSRCRRPYAGDGRSRNVSVGNRRTSVRFDPPTCRALSEIMRREAVTLDELCRRDKAGAGFR